MARRLGTRPANVAVVGFLWCCAALAAPPPLVAPSSLSASGFSSSQIQLAWNDPNTTEDGYQVERSPNGVTGFVLIATAAKNVTSYVDSGLPGATTYYYRVRATKQSSVSAYSPVASAATLAPTPPPTPTPTSPPPPPTATPTPAPPPPTATATPIPPPPTATPTPGPPPPTATATPVPPPPTATPTPIPVPAAASNLTAAAVSSSQINLAWTDNSSNETGFKVLRSLAVTGPWTEIASTAATTLSNVGLSAGTTYFYKVCAYNGAGVSPDSNVANATTWNSIPAAPGGLSASAVSSSQINLAWTDTASNETGFKIERSTATVGWAQIGTVGANVTSYASTGLSASTAYSYRVRAYNTSGDSGYSNTATATTTSSSGSRWSKRYGDVNDDRGHGVAVDGSGNVAVTGHYQGITDFGDGLVTSFTHATMGPTRDVFVASYTPTGGHIWSRSIGGGGSEEGNAVAMDGSGNLLVTGYQGTYQVDYGAGMQSTAGANDIFVAKYSSTGGHVWSKTVGGTGYDSGMGIAADSGGNVFVTGGMDAGGVNFGGGALFSAGFQDVFLVKYSATGAHVWSKRFGGSSSDSGAAVATDVSGNVVVTGTFEGAVDFGGGSLTSAGARDIFVAKYSSSGAHLWSKRFGGPGYDYATGLAADGVGDVLLTGKFQSSISFGGGSLASAGGDDAYLAKLSGASGGHIWSKGFGSTSGDNGAGVAVDANNNVAVTGHFAGTVDFGGGGLTGSSIDVFVAKYNASGAHLWSRKYGAAGYQFGSGVGMAPTGEVSVTGFFASTVDFGTGPLTSAGANDAFVASIGP